MTRECLVASVVVLAVASRAGAQTANQAPANDSALVISASFAAGEYVATNSPIALTLNRLPKAGDGALVVMIGTMDVTPLFSRRDTRLVYQPRVAPLPSGDHEVVVYLATRDAWNPVARFPIRVLTARGFAKSTVAPTATMSNKGQLAEHRTESVAPDARPTFQDFQLATGVRTLQERGHWVVETQLNALGVTNRREALRFSELSADAPTFDLANYVVHVRRGPAALSLGHVTAGTNRHLVNSFASRGAVISLGGPAATLWLGALGGAAEVGWEHPLGFTRPGHRLSTASVSVELRPQRPGALHLDVSMLDGSLLPRSGFTRAALTDAEHSTGYGVQIAASTPSQRLRVSSGVAQSRFVNPRDSLLEGDGPTVRVPPARRLARYLEMNLTLLQNVRLGVLPASTLATGWRHERVDPLYRSIGAPTRADVLSNVVDLNGTIGALALQVSHARSNDNLARLATVLRTFTRMTTSQASLPVAALLRRPTSGPAWPTLTYAMQRTHQFGAGMPERSGFTERDIPNDLSTTYDVGVQWQGPRWRGGYRLNRSGQDTRQIGRENADRVAFAHTLTVGRVVSQSLDVNLDGAIERQSSIEVGQHTHLERVGLTTNWRPTSLTSINGNATLVVTQDAPRTRRGDNMDLRAELAQGIPFGRRTAEGPRAQVFLRYARQSAINRRFIDPLTPETRTSTGLWNLASGVNIKLF